MFDKNKLYSYKELLDNYSMLNIEFKFYGQNDKGNLLLYLMTKDNKIFIFTSNNNGKSKEEYLQYELKDIETLKFKYESEVEMQDYNINVIEAKRNINANGKKRGKVEEVIITNFENKRGF